MKKRNQSTKKKKAAKKGNPAAKKKTVSSSDAVSLKEVSHKQKPVRAVPKKVVEKKKKSGGSVTDTFKKGLQFLRECKNELKKVKWPTRKELLASTAVVIVLTLIVALYLGLVDFGLIKIIKNIIG